MSEPARTRRALLEGLSHELRSPLQSLLGFAQLLGSGKLGPLNEEQQEAADALARTARRILQVSEDVLQVARIDAGREEPTWADVALDPLLARELELVRPEAEAKGLALVRAGETGVVAPTDAAKVARIV
ncbi:MAG: histidine kinase dimerization/phospho-acceptor domain-containing protein, partial [Planctomycetota bacterium]